MNENAGNTAWNEISVDSNSFSVVVAFSKILKKQFSKTFTQLAKLYIQNTICRIFLVPSDENVQKQNDRIGLSYTTGTVVIATVRQGQPVTLGQDKLTILSNTVYRVIISPVNCMSSIKKQKCWITIERGFLKFAEPFLATDIKSRDPQNKASRKN